MEILTLLTKAGEQVRTANYLGLVNTSLWLAHKCLYCGSEESKKVIVILWEGCIVIQCFHCEQIYQILWEPYDPQWHRHNDPLLLGMKSYSMTRQECAALPGFPLMGLKEESS